MAFLQELFRFLGLEGRLRLEWISSAEATKFVKVVTEFTDQIQALGPNPLAALPLEAGPLCFTPMAGEPVCSSGVAAAVTPLAQTGTA